MKIDNINSTAVTTKRDLYGKISAVNYFKLFDNVPGDDKVLVIDTMKSYKDIITIAQVVYPTDYGVTFTVYQDYFKTVMKNPGRATAKAIAAQQASALDMLKLIKNDAMSFYLAKDVDAA
jgi:hypothetical protein